jgi:hypothetical protein
LGIPALVSGIRRDFPGGARGLFRTCEACQCNHRQRDDGEPPQSRASQVVIAIVWPGAGGMDGVRCEQV